MPVTITDNEIDTVKNVRMNHLRDHSKLLILSPKDLRKFYQFVSARNPSRRIFMHNTSLRKCLGSNSADLYTLSNPRTVALMISCVAHFCSTEASEIALATASLQIFGRDSIGLPQVNCCLRLHDTPSR